VLTRVRIWLPDAPGVLGAVATAIGAAGGNVIGLEVLEREAGVAIDELVVELPFGDGVIDAVCRGVRTVPGAGVEEVTELSHAAHDREHSVLAAAAGILAAGTPTAVLNALTGHLMVLFGLSWLALADVRFEGFTEIHGDVPPLRWVAAFAEGARSGTDPANDTGGSGVFVEPVPETGLAVCGGRPTPIRRRERHEIGLLVMVASRFVDALGGREASAPI
jgi:ACT domain-containing protein